MRTKAWLWDSEEFFCDCLLSKEIYFWLSFVKRNFLWRWDSEAIFFLLSFVRIFSWRWDSETFFSFCLLSTWRRERGDGTVWQFYFCLFFITHKLSLLSKNIILFQYSEIDHRGCPSVIICKKNSPQSECQFYTCNNGSM